MELKKLTILLLSFLLIGMLEVKAQEQVTSGGGTIQSSSGEINYTLGQVFTSTNSNGIISEGVQQPYEISVVTMVNNTNTEISVSAFPNPTLDKLNLKVNSANYENLFYSLYDINGQKIQAGKIIHKETSIDMSEVKKGTYIITIQLNNKETKTYKIIKN